MVTLYWYMKGKTNFKIKKGYEKRLLLVSNSNFYVIIWILVMCRLSCEIKNVLHSMSVPNSNWAVSPTQPVTTGSCNNGIWIRMLFVHSCNCDMHLLSKVELPQIWDSYHYGRVRQPTYLSFLTKFFLFSWE